MTTAAKPDRTKSAPTPRRSQASTRQQHVSARQEASASTLLPGLARRPSLWGYLPCGLFSTLHALGLTAYLISSGTGASGDPLDLAVLFALMMVPGWITIAFVPRARSHGFHRWLTVIAVTYTSTAFAGVLTLAIGNAWVLYRFWFVENDAPTFRSRLAALRSRFAH